MDAANKKDGFSSKGRYQKALTIILPIALGIAVYINMLSNGFVFDDMYTIVHNDHIKDFGKSFPAFFNLDYFKIAQSEVSYRPVATLSYFMIYNLFNLNPLAFHLFSLLLHILNVIWVYLLVDLIQRNKTSAMIAALVFACHPVLTEAVNCISYNEDLFATFFYLLALVLYIKATTNDKPSHIPIYFFALISFFLALLSKEMAITLPVMILLYNVTLSESAGTNGFIKQSIATIAKQKSYYLGLALVALVYLALRFKILVNPSASLRPCAATLSRAPFSISSIVAQAAAVAATLPQYVPP